MFRFAARVAVCMGVGWAVFFGVAHLVADHTGEEISTTAINRNHTWDMVLGKEPIDQGDGGKLAAVIKPYVRGESDYNLSHISLTKENFANVNNYMGMEVVRDSWPDKDYYQLNAAFFSQVNQARSGQPQTIYTQINNPVPSAQLADNTVLLVSYYFIVFILSLIIARWWVLYSLPYNENAIYKASNTEIYALGFVGVIGFLLCLGSPVLLATFISGLLVTITYLIDKFAQMIATKRKPDVIKELEGLQNILLKQAVTPQRDALIDRISKAIAVVKELPNHEAREISVTIAYELEPILARIETEIRDKHNSISSAHKDLRKVEAPELVLQDSVPAQFQVPPYPNEDDYFDDDDEHNEYYTMKPSQ
jgi:hypothetical protein